MSDLKSSELSSTDPWSQLWSQTLLPSWNLLGSDPAAVALREHWFEQKSWICESSNIVDIGSGPAVLARLFASIDSAHQRPASATQWLCVDQAQIPSTSVSDLSLIHI